MHNGGYYSLWDESLEILKTFILEWFGFSVFIVLPGQFPP